MKCQQCDKPATFHITELTSGKPQELHLCEDHARDYLTQSSGEQATTGSMAAVLAQQMAQQLAVGRRPRNWPIWISRHAPYAGLHFTIFAAKGVWGAPTITFVFKPNWNR